MEIKSKQEFLKRRQEIEREVEDMLKETNSDFLLEDVQGAVFLEEDEDDMMKVFAMFDCGGDISEMDAILKVTRDAWNYFPHKGLDGLSPAEKSLEAYGRFSDEGSPDDRQKE